MAAITQPRGWGAFSGMPYGSFAGREPFVPPVVAATQTGAGKSKRTSRKKAFVVEVDGEDFIVNSEAEAQNLLDKVRETAAENAAEVTQRAAAAATKPKRKVLADARKALETPSIRVPQEFASAAADTLAAIESIYREAMQAVEIGYMMRKLADEQEEEDLLLLML